MVNPSFNSSNLCLEATQLSCQRDENTIFAQLDLSLPVGGLLQLDGANGSGKTTLLRVLAGLIPASSGTMTYLGQNLAKSSVREDFYQNLIFLGHQAGIKPELTTLENLSWFAGLEGIKDENILVQALAEVGLSGYEDQLSHQLSAGQKRRVALARLLITQRKLWLLDEPFTALDKKAVAALEELFNYHCNRGGSIILTSHHALDSLKNLQKIHLTGWNNQHNE